MCEGIERRRRVQGGWVRRSKNVVERRKGCVRGWGCEEEVREGRTWG